MNTETFVGMINNAAFLLALVLIYDTVSFRRKGSSIRIQTLTGIIIGLIGAAVMLNPWRLLPGLIFDTRSILLSMAGFYFGVVPSAIAALMTGALRIYQGGIGMWTGLSVIVSSTGLGLLWRHYSGRGHIRSRWFELYALGIFVHVVMLSCMLIMPLETSLNTLRRITAPVLLIYPIATVLLGMMLERQQRRQEVEKALQESEARYRSIFEHSTAVMLLIDPDGGRIMDANDAAVNYYGWSRDELTRMKINDINSLAHDETLNEMNAARTQSRNYFLFTHRRADGSVKYVEVYSGPVRFGEKTLLYSIVHDITERRRAEEERDRIEERLRQAQKMEAIGLLAGGIAHDFNNMLSVILGNADIAASSVDASNPIQQNLAEIRYAGERSAEFTRQLLAFSRKQIIAPKTLNLNRVIEGHHDILGRLIGEDIQIRFIPESSLWNVRVDPAQVNQILTNLAANARDAISGVGEITIRTANLVLDDPLFLGDHSLKPGEYVSLSFGDSGTGMDEETRRRIFEPFYSTKEIGKGTGMGLATVYGIVMQCEGGIRVESGPSAGTTFTIYFPRFHGGEESTDNAESGPEPAGTECVLLVEDEAQILSLAAKFLAKHGYKVLTAASPREALPLLKAHAREIDILVTDVVMPGMDGKELENQARAIKKDIRTLFMSGYTANVIAHRGVIEEDINFIQKPFTMKSLLEKIRRVLDS